MTRSREEGSDDTKVRIVFKFHERGTWRDVPVLSVDPSEPAKVESIAKNMREKIRLFDTKLRMLAPQDCFEAVTADGINTILLIPEAEIDINNKVLASASEVRAKAISRQEHGRKRVAVDDISERHHARKKLII
jgi:hypothetical protein